MDHKSHQAVIYFGAKMQREGFRAIDRIGNRIEKSGNLSGYREGLTGKRCFQRE
jgi:hypothetical protein